MSESDPLRLPMLSTQEFKATGQLLANHRLLWHERPFIVEQPRWTLDHRRLARWLAGLPWEAIVAYEQTPARLAADAPQPFGAWAEQTARISDLPLLPSAAPDLPEVLRRKMPGRKLKQVASLAALIDRRIPAQWELLEWCAGKGYLARTLAKAYGRRVACAERQPKLCAQGQELDTRCETSSRWICGDVLAVDDSLLRDRGVIALHACGDLHRNLTRRSAAQQTPAVAIVPCCYHRGLGPPAATTGLGDPPSPQRFVPMSRIGNAFDPTLDEHALRLATSQETVASPRKRQAREREQHYRMVLDLALRTALGQSHYVGAPSLPERWFRLPLSEFLVRITAEHGVDLKITNLETLAREGAERLRKARALGLVRALFRRPVEQWLALDLAHYLAEHGYAVEIGRFCPRNVTPRNIAIVGLAAKS